MWRVQKNVILAGYRKYLTTYHQAQKPFASMAAKVKTSLDQFDNISKDTLKNQYNNHMQCLTDFDLIYDDPKDIRLYNIGSLFTNSQKDAHELSRTQNYRLESKRNPVLLISRKFFSKKSLT